MDPNYDSGYFAVVFGIIIFSIILGLAAYIVSSFFLMKIFEKAGVQGKWRAWVPGYNLMVFFKLGDLSPWLVLYGVAGAVLLTWIGIGFVFSLALTVFSAIAAWRVGLKLQKDAVWVLLYLFLGLIWLGINAFDKSRWNPNIQPASWASNGFLGDRTVWAGVPTHPAAAAPSGNPPQGYAPPAQPGYAPPAQPGYAPPTQPGYAPPAGPAAPATGATDAPVPPVPPVPPAPPAVPPAPPAAPGDDQTDRTQPPA